jgi:putative glycosyltransferase (TIGR04372 family)
MSMNSGEILSAQDQTKEIFDQPSIDFRVLALLNSRALGDTIFYHIYAASTKLLFDNARLITLSRMDGRSHKASLLRFNPHKNVSMVLDKDHPGVSSDSYGSFNDLRSNNEPVPDYIFKEPHWLGENCHMPDLILSPPGMRPIALPTFENPAFLRIPDGEIGPLADVLIANGVDPNRWFCCLHYREDGYEHRPARFMRDLDPRPFMALTEDIIENLGGQVVRLGHPQMTKFPKRPGFVDLAGLVDGFDAHAFAVSRARFMIGSLSGASHLGSAFNTPTAITNNSDSLAFPGCWRDHDVALYLNIYTESGRRVSTMEQEDAGMTSNRIFLTKLRYEHGYRIMQNSPAELGQVARRLLDATTDCQGWREPSTETIPEKRPNRIEIPVHLRQRVPVVEYPDLAFPIN